MSDIIKLLPDSVANQIAAGEVIQRPASVVKELVENAVDAGSTFIKIIIKDAGRTLIQIIDNGCGMSETDARLCFERHATSKIKTANDLFCIRTMGFRGEALASVAAIAQVEMKSKRKEDEIGTCILISASEVESQQPVSCSDGTSFAVKNLFFNVPARRKFLKSPQTEFRHIIEEIQRIALANTDIAFSLFHNDEEIYNLPISPLKQKIINVFGKNIQQNLIPVDTETTMIGIKGYIGKPEFARKTSGEQFFFVNKRYMRHPYFYKAVSIAYEKILPPNTMLSFFLYFSIDPSKIDVNIHPTKTEIKFCDEYLIWQIIQASVKEALGKFNIVPSIDFDIEKFVDIPMLTDDTEIKVPEVKINPEFNPFDNVKRLSSNSNIHDFFEKHNNDNKKNWEALYEGIEKNERDDFSSSKSEEDLFAKGLSNESVEKNLFFQFKNKYILTPVKNGLMMIHQKRAHERILFERYLIMASANKKEVQKMLFPVTIELNAADAELLKEIMPDINALGFEISEFGGRSFIINGTPGNIDTGNIENIVSNFLENYKITQGDIKTSVQEKAAWALAKASSVNYSKSLALEEMKILFNQLFLCSVPNYTYDGKTIISILSNEELDNRF
ncbi:MAG: DNA mismatch repair protein MutL [Bacteroidetes bacterium RIFOXYA12_FULL_35_11]|nr:MAG: DNA mismatch repair protein MutL [Bacteroidetes bacterium GWF2_35_48]OFY76805.1 MAG: DNA mismatch repair protein MutL [Bacteroidetes bacterium RIFOXYA12_FULL_35_11]OFY97107.1 MAG: DNA mismatch repair protein MutL [Bacteroidetes bacterium RIFOXYB2_FULL_35_7]OFY98033.1 MAG: DNA mismatch repair protein MutL [Bacteroidetes bacterium RIFOXYC12_FULL_35_7]HBX49844.1 DNA mismatch repair endonuclease MutL [Bacteroidales bacterium]